MLPVLRDHGIRSEIAIFHRRAEGVERKVEEGGTRVHFVGERRRIARVWSLRRLIRRIQPDLVHTAVFEADVTGRIAAAGLGVPVAASVVNMSYGPERTADPRVSIHRLALARRLDRWTAQLLCDGVHALTAAVGEDCGTQLGMPESMIRVIPRARSRERLGHRSRERREHVRSRLGISPEEFAVLNVGRREFQKGQSTLLPAVAACGDSTLLIAGRDGAESSALAALSSELGIVDRVRFLGHRDDVPDLLVAADAFAFPSRFEGLGGAVLEALALGTPIVASDIPALREVLRSGELGVLVPVGDEAALGAALERIRLHPEDAAERSRRGREVFDSCHSPDVVYQEMADWLRQVSGMSGSVRGRLANRRRPRG